MDMRVPSGRRNSAKQRTRSIWRRYERRSDYGMRGTTSNDQDLPNPLAGDTVSNSRHIERERERKRASASTRAQVISRRRAPVVERVVSDRGAVSDREFRHSRTSACRRMCQVGKHNRSAAITCSCRSQGSWKDESPGRRCLLNVSPVMRTSTTPLLGRDSSRFSNVNRRT